MLSRGKIGVKSKKCSFALMKNDNQGNLWTGFLLAYGVAPVLYLLLSYKLGVSTLLLHWIWTKLSYYAVTEWGKASLTTAMKEELFNASYKDRLHNRASHE